MTLLAEPYACSAEHWYTHFLLSPCYPLPEMFCYLMNVCVRATTFRFVFDLQPGLRGDSYANLSLGNIYFSNLEDRTKYEKHLLHAANFYHEVLKKDDANAFAGINRMISGGTEQTS